MSVGIVGLPNVGKSTLFQALTKKKVDIANYPFCTIDPNVGIVKVPDERLDQLAKLSNSAKVIPTIIEFVDIAGLVKGAHQGEGLGNKFLSHIREVQAIVQVVRDFKDSEIIHVNQTVDPIRDIEIVNTELALKDLETGGHRLHSIEGDAKSGKKEAILEKEVLENLQRTLNKGMSVLQYFKENPKAEPLIRHLQLLTAKPMIYLVNANKETIDNALKKKIQDLGASYVVLNVKEELDKAGLSPEELGEFGLSKPRLPELIKKAYEALDLLTFLTTGPDETRAWTVKRGAKVPQAGGVIHSDFEKNFIRALVISWKKLLEAEGIPEALTKGWLHTEGKEYIVKDGDVIEIKHG
ncbi:MAG: redox-regulated ATPase YchF [Patescibacteria group bacterium]